MTLWTNKKEKFRFIGQAQTKAGASLQMFPPLVSPVLSCPVLAVLSTRQTPTVLPHSRKTPISPGAGPSISRQGIPAPQPLNVRIFALTKTIPQNTGGRSLPAPATAAHRTQSAHDTKPYQQCHANDAKHNPDLDV